MNHCARGLYLRYLPLYYCTLQTIWAHIWAIRLIAVNRRPVKSPLEKVRSIFFLSKIQFLWVLTLSHKSFVSSLDHLAAVFLQPKNARLCYKVLAAKTRKKTGKLTIPYLAFSTSPWRPPVPVAASQDYAAHAHGKSMTVGRIASQHAWAAYFMAERSGGQINRSY